MTLIRSQIRVLLSTLLNGSGICKRILKIVRPTYTTYAN